MEAGRNFARPAVNPGHAGIDLDPMANYLATADIS